jgi:peptidoglycan/LPS O-acetylase OafA/YrhL
MNWAKSTGFGIVSGMALVTIVLLSAFGYVWLNPQGGDSWDAGYFFTHPAFFIIFAAGFISGFAWKAARLRRDSN